MREPRPDPKRSDRLWWVLLVLTVVGVVVAVRLAYLNEAERSEWVTAPPSIRRPVGPEPHAESTPPLESTPERTPEPTPAPKPELAPPTADRGTAPPAEPQVVELLTTPVAVTVGGMTDACERVMRRRGPWHDSIRGQPWPECIDREGNPMVVQFCTYARLSTGVWVPSENTRDAARCRAELPLIQQGRRPRAAR